MLFKPLQKVTAQKMTRARIVRQIDKSKPGSASFLNGMNIVLYFFTKRANLYLNIAIEKP